MSQLAVIDNILEFHRVSHRLAISTDQIDYAVLGGVASVYLWQGVFYIIGDVTQGLQGVATVEE